MRKRPIGRRHLFCIALLLMGRSAWTDDLVTQAMHDELQRSMSELQIEESNRPYFISFTVEDLRATFAGASFGGLVQSADSRHRSARVEVRVGGYDLDNSNFASDSPQSLFARNLTRLPLDDNLTEVRRQLWLATDKTYKKAVEDLGKKRAVLQSRTRSEELSDFSREERATFAPAGSEANVDRERITALVRDLSSRFRQMVEVYQADVQFYASTWRTRYLNSEGSSFDRTLPLVLLTVTGATQADDGAALNDFVSFFGRGLGDLATEKDLALAIDRMGARLAAARRAPVLDSYNGPVLFEGQAAAELFAQVLAPAVLAARQPVQGAGAIFTMANAAGGLQDRIGALVLPPFLSVTDDPTRTAFEGTPLMGSYAVDDEGVPARPTRLIEHGVLKTVLCDRTPVVGVPHSTGNRRGGSIRPSNVIVEVESPKSREELVRELLRLVQERGGDYGIVVRRLGNPHFEGGDVLERVFGPDEDDIQMPIEVYKVYHDGHEERVRSVRISGMSPAAFKDIVAVSSADEVYTAPFAVGGVAPSPPYFSFASGTTLPVVSWVVPSLLFEDMTLKKPSGETPRPPITSHPYFDRKGE